MQCTGDHLAAGVRIRVTSVGLPVPGDPPPLRIVPAAKTSSTPAKKTAAKKTTAKTTAAKKTAAKTSVAKKPAAKPVLLSGGNPQIAKADGNAPVQAYIAALSGWKRDVASRIDALIMRTAPGAQKAVKWNSPFYGMPGRGWFVAMHVFSKAVKVTFFKGTSLTPAPTGGGGQDARWIDVHESDLDEVKLAKWVKQAAAIPGWGGK